MVVKAGIFTNMMVLAAERLQKHSAGSWWVLQVTDTVRCFVPAPGPAAQNLRRAIEIQPQEPAGAHTVRESTQVS